MDGNLQNIQGRGLESSIPHRLVSSPESTIEASTNAEWLKHNLLSLGRPTLKIPNRISADLVIGRWRWHSRLLESFGSPEIDGICRHGRGEAGFRDLS